MLKSKPLDPALVAGLMLALAAMAGLLFENISGLQPIYDKLLLTRFTIGPEGAALTKPILLWINDGLMAIFFLFVALEIKSEVRQGALRSWSAAALPVYGAIGGIVAPSLIFLGIVGIESAEAQGWAIPAATDIAFALGVLSLFGNRIPPLLKTFLLTLAVVDDLAAIAIIALFYTANLSLAALATAAACLVVLAAMNIRGVANLIAYMLVGAVLWLAVLKSGVHATLAGVALGFAIPLAANSSGRSLAKSVENELKPVVNFVILPVFAFANAGVPLAGLSWDTLLAPLSLAVGAGLIVGKQLGVFGAVYLATRSGLAARPSALSWSLIYGASCLAGIGFTMSLFIGGLAFETQADQNMVRIGVLTGSLISGVIGAAVLFWATRGQMSQKDIASSTQAAADPASGP